MSNIELRPSVQTNRPVGTVDIYKDGEYFGVVWPARRKDGTLVGYGSIGNKVGKYAPTMDKAVAVTIAYYEARDAAKGK